MALSACLAGGEDNLRDILKPTFPIDTGVYNVRSLSPDDQDTKLNVSWNSDHYVISLFDKEQDTYKTPANTWFFQTQKANTFIVQIEN